MQLIEKTPVVFVSLCASKISNGSHKFQAKLNELLSRNKLEIELIGDEINSFEELISKEYFHPVIWNIISTEKHDKLQVVKLHVQGLYMNWVMEFEKQIESHSRKTSHVGSSVDLSSRPDQKKKLNQETNKDKKSKSQSFKDKKSKPKDDYPSLEPKEACKNNQKKEQTKKKSTKKTKNPQMKAKFTWKYENEKMHSFDEFEKPIVDKLEKFFAVDTTPHKVLKGQIFHQYKSVDFLKMKLIEKKDDAPTTIIRCEVLKGK
ncbi:hypothetical protein Bpfe_027008 [Biomphalaria pfeifferi]|uniref:Uncharacterized protein n=1 Tax=Biomphalaria pfeifferi TaxID=112525 RepID=A0AAD8AWA5_BIOPF|nr:hypothetical protein Bpfe_027008 [Biomphalaria pfeifferi]